MEFYSKLLAHEIGPCTMRTNACLPTRGNRVEKKLKQLDVDTVDVDVDDFQSKTLALVVRNELFFSFFCQFQFQCQQIKLIDDPGKKRKRLKPRFSPTSPHSRLI